MDIESAKIIGMALAVGLGVIGPGIGIGLVVGKALEALAIFALVIGFILKYS